MMLSYFLRLRMKVSKEALSMSSHLTYALATGVSGFSPRSQMANRYLHYNPFSLKQKTYYAQKVEFYETSLRELAKGLGTKKY